MPSRFGNGERQHPLRGPIQSCDRSVHTGPVNRDGRWGHPPETRPECRWPDFACVFLNAKWGEGTPDRRHRSGIPLHVALIAQSSRTLVSLLYCSAEDHPNCSRAIGAREAITRAATNPEIMTFMMILLSLAWLELRPPINRGVGAPIPDQLDRCPWHRMHLPYRPSRYKCVR